jgi:predicted DNA-binding transcriptional regulator AlpA
MNTTANPERIIRRKELAQRLGVSSTTLWRMRYELPPHIKLSSRISGWRLSDIDNWIENRAVVPTPIASDVP